MHIEVWIYAILASPRSCRWLVRLPWTASLARSRTSPAVWTTELFLETNLVLTAIWALLYAGGATVAAAAPLWIQVAYGLGLAAFGRLLSRLGEWYLGRRLRATA